MWVNKNSDCLVAAAGRRLGADTAKGGFNHAGQDLVDTAKNKVPACTSERQHPVLHLHKTELF
jgi:hypothetical protein